MKYISSFSGKNSYLSNFYMCLIPWDGIKYPSVEHAFQAAKTHDLKLRKLIASAPTPGIAKSRGRKLVLRLDWEDIKIDIMETLVEIKFTIHEELEELLVDTGEIELIEGNRWHDNFWGNCTCVRCERIIPRNELGRILMDCRKNILESWMSD